MIRQNGKWVNGIGSWTPRVFEGPKIEVDLPPLRYTRIKLKCAVCGKQFDDYEDTYESRVVPMCMRCEHPKRYPRGEGLTQRWPEEFDMPLRSSGRLMRRQLRQITAALTALEEECKKPLLMK